MGLLANGHETQPAPPEPKPEADADPPAGSGAQPVVLGAVQQLLGDRVQIQEAARQAAFQRADVDIKIVGLVVHGIGDQPIGATLKAVANEYLPLLRNRIEVSTSISVKPLDDDGPAEVKIWFRDSAIDKVYELRFIEVWWAQSFIVPTIAEFTMGTFSIAARVLRHPRSPKQAGGGGWMVQLQRLWVEAAAVPLGLLAVPFLLLLSISDFALPKYFMPPKVLALQRWLVNFFTRSLGDMWIYMLNPWEASRIRARFEERFREMLAPIEQQNDAVSKGVSKDWAKIKAAFVIAHSMGSVVAYEALTGRRMTELLLRNFEAGGKKPEFHLVTVGSALNSAWEIAPPSERFRFYRRLADPVKWTNLWSAPDPVARGALQPPAEAGPVEDVSVVNQMDVFSDHSAYWNNAEEVVALILDKITGGALADQLRMRVADRHKRVAKLALAKLLFWMACTLSLPIAFAVSFSKDMHVGLADKYIDKLGSGWAIDHLLWPLIWAAAVSVVLVAFYSTAVKRVWNHFDQRDKYKKP